MNSATVTCHFKIKNDYFRTFFAFPCHFIHSFPNARLMSLFPFLRKEVKCNMYSATMSI